MCYYSPDLQSVNVEGQQPTSRGNTVLMNGALRHHNTVNYTVCVSAIHVCIGE